MREGKRPIRFLKVVFCKCSRAEHMQTFQWLGLCHPSFQPYGTLQQHSEGLDPHGILHKYGVPWLYKLKFLKSALRSLGVKGCPLYLFPIIHEGPQTSTSHTLNSSELEMLLFTDHTVSLQGSHCAIWYGCYLTTLNSSCQKISKWEATILKSKMTLIIRNLLCAPFAMSCGLGEKVWNSDVLSGLFW